MLVRRTEKIAEGRELAIKRCSFLLNLIAILFFLSSILSNTDAERERIYQGAVRARNFKITETQKVLPTTARKGRDGVAT